MRRTRRPDAGLSLAETLVAVFVTALIAAAAAGALTVTAQSRDRVAATAEAVRALESVHALLRDDIAQASSRAVRVERRSAPVAFEGGDDTLVRLVRGGWTNPGGVEPRGGVQPVAWLVRDGVLIRRASLRPDTDAPSAVVERPLLTGVETASVAFYAAGGWSRVWRAGAGGRLPEAVRVRLTLKDGRRFDWTFLTLEGGRNARV